MKKTETVKKIERYRARIDLIDAKILELLTRRFDLCRKIARCKKNGGIPLRQEKREQMILKKLVTEGQKRGLGRSFLQTIFQTILRYSRSIQKETPPEKTTVFQAPHFDKKSKI